MNKKVSKLLVEKHQRNKIEKTSNDMDMYVN